MTPPAPGRAPTIVRSHAANEVGFGIALPRRQLLAAAAGLAFGCGERDSIELWLGGDVELGGGGAARLAPLASLLRGAAGIVNLEGAVGDGPPARGAPVWNAAHALTTLDGVDVLTIANNHTADRGLEGITATLDAVRAAGRLPAGAIAGAARLDRWRRPVIITAHDLAAGVPETLAADLATPPGSLLVATFHVTGPPSLLPRPELRAAADIALAAGARVVAAHGTHALGPVERRGNAVIAWGLGNLLFTCPCTEEQDGAILRLSIPHGDAALDAWIIPIDAGLRGAPARPAKDPALIFELFAALGSTPLLPLANAAAF